MFQHDHSEIAKRAGGNVPLHIIYAFSLWKRGLKRYDGRFSTIAQILYWRADHTRPLKYMHSSFGTY